MYSALPSMPPDVIMLREDASARTTHILPTNPTVDQQYRQRMTGTIFHRTIRDGAVCRSPRHSLLCHLPPLLIPAPRTFVYSLIALLPS